MPLPYMMALKYDINGQKNCTFTYRTHYNKEITLTNLNHRLNMPEIRNDNERMAFGLIRPRYYDNPELLDILWTHSRMVADMALECIARRGLTDVDPGFVERAALLHDIGIVMTDAPSIHCFGPLPYIRHGLAGGEMLRAEGFEEYARVCERHTGAGLTADDIRNQHLPLPEQDFLPETMAERLVCYADKFYSKSGDLTRRKSLEKVRLQMVRHGDDTLRRFDALHLLFG